MVAARAAHELPVAVQLRQDFGMDARPPVEVIGILCDQELELAEPLEFDKGKVRCVGLDLVRRNPPPRR